MKRITNIKALYCSLKLYNDHLSLLFRASHSHASLHLLATHKHPPLLRRRRRVEAVPQRAPAEEAAVEPRRQQPAAAPLRLARERQREARVVVAVRESNAHDGQIR